MDRMKNLQQLQQIELFKLLEYYGEDIQRHGYKHYKLKNHDSLIITNNKYYWNSKHVGGGAISLLKNLYNKSTKEAVEMIIKYQKDNDKNFDFKEMEPKKEQKFFIKNDFEKVKQYLVDKRGIDLLIIKGLYKNHLIKIDKKNNILFTIKDKSGDIKGYDVIGTTEKKYRANTSQGYGTNFRNVGKIETLYIFESPIDLVSYLEIAKNANKKYEKTMFLSLSGLREDILKNYLDTDIKKIIACVDNDLAGTNFYNYLNKKYNKQFEIERELPINKDWNEDLKEIKIKKEKEIDDDWER